MKQVHREKRAEAARHTLPKDNVATKTAQNPPIHNRLAVMLLSNRSLCKEHPTAAATINSMGYKQEKSRQVLWIR